MSSEMLASAYNVLTGPANGLFGRAGNNSASNLPSPTALGNLSTWYDVSDKSSLTLDGSDNCQLIADKSGNSAENCLVLPGVSGNYANTPDSAALDITGDIDIIARCQFATWATGTYTIVSKRLQTGNQISYDLNLVNGALGGRWSSNGAVNAGESALSDATVTFAAFAIGWVRVTRASASGDVKFYTSTDGTTWTQLGTTQATNAGAIYASTANVEVGSHTSGTNNVLRGSVYRAIIKNGIDGTTAFDADFSTVPKLATSFTESSSEAATVTINTTAIALPARIHGARDLYMGTAASQPLYTTRNGRVGLLFDGGADYMKTAPFALSQPENVYFVGEQVTWTSTDYLMDGAASNSGAITQTTSTPQLNISAGTSVAANTGLSAQTAGVVNAVFNGASSSLRINRGTATTGNAGAANMTGLTVASAGTAGTYGNLFLSELLIYDTTAQDTATQDRIALYEGQKWGISV